MIGVACNVHAYAPPARRESGLDVVLRGAPAGLAEADIVAALPIAGCTLTRFRRTASGKPVPLPLVRVACSSVADRERLLRAGELVLGGFSCTVEPARTPEGSPAALGRRLDVDVDALLSRAVLRAAVCVEAKAGAVAAARFVREFARTDCAEQPAPRVCVCRETSDYHQVAMAAITQDDVVLEIGSDLGKLCALAWPRCHGRVLGVDLSSHSVARARASYPDIAFEVLDALQVGAAAALARAAVAALAQPRTASAEGLPMAFAGFTAVFIDINGSRLLPAVAAVLQMVLDELSAATAVVAMAEPLPLRLVCVKSRAMHERLACALAEPRCTNKSAAS